MENDLWWKTAIDGRWPVSRNPPLIRGRAWCRGLRSRRSRAHAHHCHDPQVYQLFFSTSTSSSSLSISRLRSQTLIAAVQSLLSCSFFFSVTSAAMIAKFPMSIVCVNGMLWTLACVKLLFSSLPLSSLLFSSSTAARPGYGCLPFLMMPSGKSEKWAFRRSEEVLPGGSLSATAFRYSNDSNVESERWFINVIFY